MEKWLSRIGVLLVALFSGALHAAVGSCPVNFADGIQSHYSGSDGNRGVINFEWNAQLLNSPDNVLQARRVTRNSGSSLGTCGGRWVIWWPPYQEIECQADPSSAAPVQAAGAFPNTAANTVDRTYNSGSSVLAASGSNQYDNVTVGSSAQLTIQSNGQPFYIDNLTLRSSSRLILAPGDYWIGSLTTNNAARIQVSGSSGQVRLFVRDSLSVGSDVLLNSPSIDGQGDSQRLFVYAYDSVSFNNGATIEVRLPVQRGEPEQRLGRQPGQRQLCLRGNHRAKRHPGDQFPGLLHRPERTMRGGASGRTGPELVHG